MADTNNTERAAFEAWYCDQMRAAGFNADEGIAHLREGSHYGAHRVMLNGKWEGWQARASMAAEAEPVAQVVDHERMSVLWLGDRPSAGTKLYAAPQPNAALADGWMPIETAPKFSEHSIPMRLLLGYAPDDIHSDGFVSQGHWIEAEEDYPDSMGHDGGWVDECFYFFSPGRSFGAEKYRSAGTQPTHWRPLPAPPTLNASKGESHG